MKQAEKLIAAYDMLPQQGTVLVAVSGGRDSMCLLHWLHGRGVSVEAAHFNHRLRGEASDGDERFVRETCRAWGIPCRVGAGDVLREAKENGWSVEEAARRMRYGFLERTADAVGAVRIATAHHAQDCAETLLWNLVRGTGADGMGIPPVRGRYIRPLLTTPRAEIEAYLAENGIPYREDETNADESYTRNFLRREVLPKLRQTNPQAAQHMAEASLRLLAESAYLDSLAASYLPAETDADGAALACRDFRAVPEALRVRLLRLLLARRGYAQKDLTARHYEALCALAANGKRAQLDLPNGILARCDGENVFLCTQSAAPEDVPVSLDGETNWGDYTIFCRKEAKNRPFGPHTICLACDMIQETVSVGAWRPQDRLTLPGAPGARSLKRLFAERGVAPDERERLPVLHCGARTAAALGVGTDAAFTAETGKQYVLTFTKNKKE